MGRIVGIDLGTTNSVVSCMDGGEPMIVPNSRGERLTPSVVAFGKNNETLVGQTAKNQAVINHERTITSIKRRMGNDWEMKVDDEVYTPARVSSLILAKLKADAEAFLDEDVDRAIITVPAYFNDNQRQATKLAGELAGLEVLRLINEPTAAALSYGLSERFEGSALVFDLGGGTFDVSILDLGDGVFEVIATAGDNQLGGDDFDHRIMESIMTGFHKQYGIDLSQDRMAVQKILEAAEKTKVELSESMVAAINIPFISANESGPLHIDLELGREQFESMIEDHLARMTEILERALNDAGRAPEEIDRVLLVGGSTRIPAVQRLIERFFEGKVHKNINPDECVSIGAAIQTAIIEGKLTGLVLVDVTPLTLGIETENDIFVPIIPRNTTIPATASRMFTTISDYQRSVEVSVLQGERKQAARNIPLGKFLLKGINPVRKGAARIQVTFDIDVNGIVHVSARDLDTNAAKEIEISVKDKLRDDEIDYLVSEGERFAEDDEAFVELQGLVREAGGLMAGIKEEMGRLGEIPEEVSDEINDVIVFLGESLESEDVDRIRDAIVLVKSHLEELKEF